MNALGVIDEQGEVTRVAAEAKIALQTGDTARSAPLFRRAGELLESAVGRLARASERDLARFLAATHYYKAGAYTDAARVCDRIRGGRLPARVRHLYPPFLRKVRERSAPDYARGPNQRLQDHYHLAISQEDPVAAQRVLDILIDHPYIFSRSFMAYLRARCCEILGDRRAATMFYRSAWRFDPDNPHYPLAYLDSLCKEGKHAEAWVIAEEQLEKVPGVRSSIYAMSVINARLIRDRAVGDPSDEPARQRRRDELLRLFDSAMRASQALTPDERRPVAMLIDYACLIAWVSYIEVNDSARQLEVLDRWIELRPDSPHPRVLRGMATYPGEASDRDFREAVRLGSGDPLPYYFLAQDSLRSRRFRECERLCSEALQRGPDPEIRATLLAWRAISHWSLRPREDRQIREFFDEARRADPASSWIENCARAFEEGAGPPDPSSSLPPGDSTISIQRARRFAEESSRRILNGMSPIPSSSAA